MAGALDGIRVIDFGQYLAGPLAALLLADQDAEVIRVDPPGGPRWRHPANAVLQRGKRSIVLNLKSPNDLAIARDLVASADVVIENFRPGVMERLGLGPLAMTERHPRLVFCSLPGFAADDPRAGLAGWEGVVSAAAGLYYPRLPAAPADPIYSAVPLASSYAAFIAAHSIVAALIARHRGGFGQHIEVALFDAAFQVMGREAQIVNGVPAARERLPINRAVIKRHRCGDGRWVDISPPLRGFGWFAERYLPKSAPRRRGRTGRAAVRTVPDAQRCRLGACGQRRDRRADGAVPDQRRVAAGRACARQPLRHSACRPRTGADLASRLPDRLVAHAAEGARATPCARRGPRGDPRGIGGTAATGLARRSAGNWRPTTRRLSRARPVANSRRTNSVPRLSRIRRRGHQDQQSAPENPLATTGHTFVNNGKRTLLLDLRAPQGRELLWRLVERADVFHQNFVRGLAERLGLDEAALRRRRPDIV